MGITAAGNWFSCNFVLPFIDNAKISKENKSINGCYFWKPMASFQDHAWSSMFASVLLNQFQVSLVHYFQAYKSMLICVLHTGSNTTNFI